MTGYVVMDVTMVKELSGTQKDSCALLSKKKKNFPPLVKESLAVSTLVRELFGTRGVGTQAK